MAVPVQRRLIGTLMMTAALGGLGQLIGLTVAGLIVRDLLGTKHWVGTANAASQVGAGVGSAMLAAYMQRKGARRHGLVLGYLIGACGASLAVLAVRWHSYPMLIGALMLYGVASSSNGLSRYSAGDTARPDNRARIVSFVVWASTIGVVLGPKLAGPAGRRFQSLAGSEKGGAFAVAAVAFLLAAVVLNVMLRPDPMSIARAAAPPVAGASTKIDLRACLQRPFVRLSIFTLAMGQVVMVGVMSVTNIHLADHGYTLGGIGTVLSAHVLGMFAPSPISGWLCDRIGRVPVIVGANLMMILGASLAALADPANHGSMILALFLLGFGWNGNFVAGSALVSEAALPHERTRLQGVADLVTQVSSATAAISAGLLVGTTGYPTMALIGAGVAGMLTVVVMAARGVTRPAEEEEAALSLTR